MPDPTNERSAEPRDGKFDSEWFSERKDPIAAGRYTHAIDTAFGIAEAVLKASREVLTEFASTQAGELLRDAKEVREVFCVGGMTGFNWPTEEASFRCTEGMERLAGVLYKLVDSSDPSMVLAAVTEAASLRTAVFSIRHLFGKPEPEQDPGQDS